VLTKQTHIGIIIRKHRQRLMVSQEALAQMANMDRTYISMLERGQASPTLKTLFFIANALATRPSQLISELEELDVVGD